jgi:hypothetical protein
MSERSLDRARSRLANQIVDALFCAAGPEATRIALKRAAKGHPWDTEREEDLGGLCRSAALERVQWALRNPK